jgi:acetylornithine/succinyldiaminopimelate/putrescine aminotransferase
VRLLPPLIIGEEEIAAATGAIERAAERLTRAVKEARGAAS